MVRRNGGAVATVKREVRRRRGSGKSDKRAPDEAPEASGGRSKESRMRRFFRENGLSFAAFGLFAVCLIGQFVTGLHEYNSEQEEHRQPTVSAADYVRSGHFFEVTFENWESEFLQMAAFVVLTAMLYQKGSPESKKLDEKEEVDEDPREALRSPQKRANAPWPVRRGGFVLKLYEHSLSLALTLLFVMSFTLHAIGGAANYNEEQVTHGGETISTLDYIGTSRFWFESFQNWQSEFLAVGALFVLTVWLRERGSPQSKPVAAGHDETGAQ
jgi:hypothetical protein